MADKLKRTTHPGTSGDGGMLRRQLSTPSAASLCTPSAPSDLQRQVSLYHQSCFLYPVTFVLRRHVSLYVCLADGCTVLSPHIRLSCLISWPSFLSFMAAAESGTMYLCRGTLLSRSCCCCLCDAHHVTRVTRVTTCTRVTTGTRLRGSGAQHTT
jgi:hypothetical protein